MLRRMSLREMIEFYDRNGYHAFPIKGGDGTDGDDSDGDDDEGDDKEEDDSQNRQSSTKTYTQDQVDTIVKRRLKRGDPKREEAIKAQIKADMDREAKQKQGEFETLWNDAQPKLNRLTDLEDIVVKYDELAEERFEAMFATLPDFIQDTLPDEDASGLEKEAWLTRKALPALAKYNAKHGKKDDDTEEDSKKGDDKKVGTTKPGLTRKNKPDVSSKDRQAKIDKILESSKRQGMYRSLG